MSIILYHYSDKTHDPLKTREAQGFVTSPEALNEELELKQYTASSQYTRSEELN